MVCGNMTMGNGNSGSSTMGADSDISRNIVHARGGANLVDSFVRRGQIERYALSHEWWEKPIIENLRTTALAESFARDGYVVWPALIAEPRLSLLYRYARLAAERGGMKAGDHQSPDTPSAHGDFMMDG